jgi:phosphonoacetaldehyde hydrolase
MTDLHFSYQRTYRGGLQAVIFDWAGTTVDFGNMAPATACVETFRRQGVFVSLLEARQSGKPWREWIQQVSQLESVARRWHEAHGRPCTERDVDIMFAEFVPVLCETLVNHSRLIPGLLEVVRDCKARGRKIGSLTGYLPQMLEVLRNAAAGQGYEPDCYVCPTDVPGGRPHPYMCLQNMINLQVWPAQACVKVDDIVPGVEEGLNAGMWTVGLAISGNQVGLPLDEWQALPAQERQIKREGAYRRLRASGAHYVIDTVADLIPCLDDIETRLARGEKP